MNIDMSGIAPNDSDNFMEKDDHNMLFGTGNIGPDRIRLSMAKMTGAVPTDANAANMLGASENYQSYEGEFRIEKGFVNLEYIKDWCVCNPHKPKGADHVVYTCFGHDKNGRFEIFRRYSDFFTLRELFVDRWAGLYIPPIPNKRTVGNTKAEFVNERCFLLNLFFRQLARCPYLVESAEFEIFVRPQSANIKREMQVQARISPENHLIRIQSYFSFMGQISDPAIQE